MLALLAHPYVKGGGAIGKVLEYAGEAVDAMSVDERATLTNMAAEAGAFAGIVAPDERTARFLAERRGVPLGEARGLCAGLAADPEAVYASVLTFDVSALAPLVALPGDPGNGVRIADLPAPVPVDIAYGGSCTAGKREDMEMLAAVLAEGLARGRRVAPGVRFYVQFGSRDVREWCRDRGYLDALRARRRHHDRAGLRRVHRGGPRRLDAARRGDRQRDQPQLPGPERARVRLPREPVRRRGVRARG